GQQRLGVGLVQLEDTIGRNDQGSAGQCLYMRDAFRRLQPRHLRRRPKPVGARRPNVDHPRRRRAPPRPCQNLRGRVDLVVVAGSGKGRELRDVVGEPGRLVRQPQEAVLDHSRLGVQAHDLVAVRLHARHVRHPRLDQLLDELRARGLVLDQDGLRAEELVLLGDGALELGKAELPAEYVEEIEVLALEAPGGADGIVGELGGLLAVPQLCTIRSNFWGRWSREERRSHAALIMPPPAGAGLCWYWPAKFISPIIVRIRPSVSKDSRSGCNASPALRQNSFAPEIVSTQ